MQGLAGMSQSQIFAPQTPIFFPRPRSQPYTPPVQQVTPPVIISSSTFVFEQTIAAATWTIDYPFIGQFPSVTITDPVGNVVLTDVQYISGLNRVIITFAQPFAGIAYLNV